MSPSTGSKHLPAMSERWRSSAVFGALIVLMLAALATVGLYSFRQFALQGAEARARTAAEIVRVSLTEAMANGAVDRRAQLLGRIGLGAELEDLRVVRGAGVIRQYGEGLAQEQSIDDIDRAVLASGQARYAVVDGRDGVALRAVIPYVATFGSQPDCLQCHQVAPGEVLGAINIRISLAETRLLALGWVAVLVVIGGSFAALSLYLLRRQYQPVTAVAASVEEAVHRAAAGDFRTRLPGGTEGAAGHIAAGVNRLMQALDESVGTINSRVEQLMEYDLPRSGNMLLSTLEMVEGLVDANRFKQAIEEDESKEEVYARLARVMGEHFDLATFSIYEVANSKNHIRPAIVDGLPDGEARWCDQEILVRADGCRARRTGRMVDGIREPGICNMFRPRSGESGMGHVCLPMMQSGNAGCIVQMVASADTAPLVQVLVPFLRVYLREAAPVLEAKRLMASLRDSSFQDAMTGLYNRRFIEAYMETLQSGVRRKGSHLAVLMLDVDHFKKVNDTHGHDAGDKVLVAVANTLKQTLRGSDILVRFGGEEFVAFLQDTDGDAALIAAEKVRAAIEAMKIPVPNAVLKKTISIGVADFPGDSDDFWQAVKFADVALYTAKERGRNRVVRFTRELWNQAEGAGG